MNFTEFSFWWLCVVIGVPLLVVREAATKLGKWRDPSDSVLLFVFSSALFWAASPLSFIIHIVELLINYGVFRALPFVSRPTAYLLAGAAITLDLSVLAYFKYADFLLHDVINPMLPIGLNVESQIGQNGLPPGISFYTFQVVAFMIDTVRDPQSKPARLLDYLNFASFFPLVVAGPIERRGHLLPQMERFRLRYSADDLDTGLRWIAAGAFMKFVLADNLAALVRLTNTTNPWIVLSSVYLFGLRIYFDFAGYSFLALGLGRLLGFRLTVNFLAPYTATNIAEFWRRWHVTLSQWFRDYVYIPLGGSRRGLIVFNLLIVFIISGLWHGAGWNYILWGLYHGLLLVAARYLMPAVRLPRFVAWLVTFNAVMLGWLLFMEPDIARVFAKLQVLWTPSAYSAFALRGAIDSYSIVERGSLLMTLMFAGVVLMVEWRGTKMNSTQPYGILLASPVAPMLLAMSLLFGARYVSEFVYFAF